MKLNEFYHLIIYRLNCIRRDRNATYKLVAGFSNSFFFSKAPISVEVQLSFTDLTNENVIPAINITTAQGATAFQFLQLASEQNPCYLFQYITYQSLGHYITTICCVEQNTTSNFYWFVYINNTLSPVGVDFLKPNNGDILKFEYRFINSTNGSHSNTTSAGMFTQDNSDFFDL